MKHQLLSTLIKNSSIAKDHFEMILHAPEIAKEARAGQFVQIKIEEPELLLRRPMSIAGVDAEKGEIRLIYKIAGKGTQALSKLKAQNKLDLIGPLGNFFKINKQTQEIILAAGGCGVGPILCLANSIVGTAHCAVPTIARTAQCAVPTLPQIIAFVGARKKKFIIGEQELKKLNIKTHIATDDGSYGHKGFVSEILEKYLTEHSHKQAQTICCGPAPMMKSVAQIAKKYKIACQISLEEKMACGFGICLGCAVKVKNNYQRVCWEGPVFDSQVIQW